MKLFVDGTEVELEIPEGRVIQSGDRLLVTTKDGVHSALAVRKGNDLLVSYLGKQYILTQRQSRSRTAHPVSTGDITAPMPGQVVDIRVAQGDTVTKGQVLLVLEAMKTQQPFTSPFDGKVEALPVTMGQLVGEHALLIKVTKA